MTQSPTIPNVDVETLREAIRDEYAEVADNPEKGFHFHTGRPLAKKLGYSDDLIAVVPESSIASLAGTGNPFSLGDIVAGEKVVDVGSGAGFDSFIAAHLVGERGHVIGVDMTDEMLAKARASASQAGVGNVEFQQGLGESLPVDSEWADVVISNGVVNLCPDKRGVFEEMHRVLRPGGRIQIGDIIVQEAVPDSAKEDVDLWTG